MSSDGLCECGCGGRAPLPPTSNASKGWVAGKHLRFLKGHNRRKRGLLWKEEDRGFTTPCRIWQRGLSHGYGAFRHEGKVVKAHRFVYEWMRGPIPQGLEIDHLCRQRDCIRLEHLEAVTHEENVRRAYA